MYREIPQYCLKAYALFYTRFGTSRQFEQSELDWVVSQPMKKKIFSILLNSNWIRKKSRNSYLCNKPSEIFTHLLEFRVPEIMKISKREYSFTGLSAIEIWSDYSYIQRDMKRSPYFIKILKKDIKYWKGFFAKEGTPAYEKQGTNIGEFIIMIPVDRIVCWNKQGLRVDPLDETMNEAGQNELYAYAYNYMREKYGQAATA
jgi:hypothetical protein